MWHRRVRSNHVEDRGSVDGVPGRCLPVRASGDRALPTRPPGHVRAATRVPPGAGRRAVHVRPQRIGSWAQRPQHRGRVDRKMGHAPRRHPVASALLRQIHGSTSRGAIPGRLRRSRWRRRLVRAPSGVHRRGDGRRATRTALDRRRPLPDAGADRDPESAAAGVDPGPRFEPPELADRTKPPTQLADVLSGLRRLSARQGAGRHAAEPAGSAHLSPPQPGHGLAPLCGAGPRLAIELLADRVYPLGQRPRRVARGSRRVFGGRRSAAADHVGHVGGVEPSGAIRGRGQGHGPRSAGGPCSSAPSTARSTS